MGVFLVLFSNKTLVNNIIQQYCTIYKTQKYKTYSIIVSNVDRVPKTKHSISKAFKVGLSISKVSRCLLQPLAEPLCIFCGLSISVGSHNKHTD